MSTIRRIFVFGLSEIEPIKSNDVEISFGDKTIDQNLSNYDIIIYFVGAFPYEYTMGGLHQQLLRGISPEAIRREKEVRQALETGRIVCFIGSHGKDYIFSRILKSYNIHFDDIYESRVYSGLKIRRSEFKPFLNDVGATTIEFNKDAIDDVICTTSHDNVVGFSKQIGKGLLLFLPCILGSWKVDYVIDHLENLGKELISYSTRVILEPPNWLTNFQFTNERAIRDEVDRIKKAELAPLEKKLIYYNQMKSILWLGDNNLVEATKDFLKSLGFEIYVEEIYEEDLWIVDNVEKQIIIEVKSKNKNLTRQDISKLDEHREARQVPNLTGLLIANTFMVANSIEIKDQPFPSNVIEKAVNTDVLITRTIDLCRIYDRLEKCEILGHVTLLKTMIGKKGWLTLTDNEITIIS